MSVKLRMTRIGRHKDPFFRIVAADSRYSATGRIIEQIGTFDSETGKAHINEEIAMKWLKNGAKPSESTKTLFTDIGLIAKYNAQKKPSHKKSKTVKTNKFDRKPKTKIETVETTIEKSNPKVEINTNEDKQGE